MSDIKKIVLVGNPNSGKSAIFSRLTGIDVISSNYPGTTVEIIKGSIRIDNKKYELIDSPGIYSLEPTSKAEEIANLTIDDSDVIINIIDSTNLERNLNLTLQLIKKQKPMLIALNFWDEIKHKGIEIDYKKLEEILNIPVIPTCAITGEGIKELVSKIDKAKTSDLKFLMEKKWEEIGKIIEKIQKVHHKHHTILERIDELSINPVTGIIIASVVLFLCFWFIRVLGEGFINKLLDPLFNNFYMPFINNLKKLNMPEFLYKLLFGTSGKVMESFGVLTTGIYIPFVIVLPYILAFYLVLSILEDSGYLPRLSVLLDNILHKFGIHGYSSIPILLGFGCKVPALFSIRILESEREKIITTILILLSAPCMPQTAMIFSLGAPFGLKVISIIFILLLMISITSSFLLNKFLKGEAQELFLEIPPYRIPSFTMIIKKLWLRIKNFLFEAIPLIISGVFLINVLDIIGFINLLSEILGKPFELIMGMPPEITSVLLLGFLRKDVSISMLAPFGLNANQFIIASIFLVIYLPCIASFFTLVKELGFKITLKIIFLNLSIAFFSSILLNILLKII